MGATIKKKERKEGRKEGDRADVRVGKVLDPFHLPPLQARGAGTSSAGPGGRDTQGMCHILSTSPAGWAHDLTRNHEVAGSVPALA